MHDGELSSLNDSDLSIGQELIIPGVKLSFATDRAAD